MLVFPSSTLFFFFNDTATTEIYTLSLHDALPISDEQGLPGINSGVQFMVLAPGATPKPVIDHLSAELRKVVGRSEEHTSELQSQSNLVCRLLLEKKKQISRTQ